MNRDSLVSSYSPLAFSPALQTYFSIYFGKLITFKIKEQGFFASGTQFYILGQVESELGVTMWWN